MHGAYLIEIARTSPAMRLDRKENGFVGHAAIAPKWQRDCLTRFRKSDYS
jgi:hypothetical protein